MRRKRAKIILSEQNRLRLQAITRKHSAIQSLVLRAEIILLAEELQDNKAVAIALNVSARHIGRLLKKLELRPHKNKYWLHKKADEFREQKIANICALYKDAQALKKNKHNNH
jgi:hypothetical protein